MTGNVFGKLMFGLTQPVSHHVHWLREAEHNGRLNTPFSTGFVAMDGDEAVEAVQLHESDIDAMRDRSPWVCGIVVRPEYQGGQVGSRLLGALEGFARAQDVERL